MNRAAAAAEGAAEGIDLSVMLSSYKGKSHTTSLATMEAIATATPATATVATADTAMAVAAMAATAATVATVDTVATDAGAAAAATVDTVATVATAVGERRSRTFGDRNRSSVSKTQANAVCVRQTSHRSLAHFEPRLFACFLPLFCHSFHSL